LIPDTFEYIWPHLGASPSETGVWDAVAIGAVTLNRHTEQAYSRVDSDRILFTWVWIANAALALKSCACWCTISNRLDN
jgi:hypothetical protein